MKPELVKVGIIQSPEKCFLNLDFLNSPNKDIQATIATSNNYCLFTNNGFKNFEEIVIPNDCKIESILSKQIIEINSVESHDLHVKPFDYSVFEDENIEENCKLNFNNAQSKLLISNNTVFAQPLNCQSVYNLSNDDSKSYEADNSRGVARVSNSSFSNVNMREFKVCLKPSKPFIPKKLRSTISENKYEDNKINEFCQLDNEENSSCASNFGSMNLLNTKCTSMNKFTCRFDIQIQNESEFRVARRIIGFKGGNMKRIIDMCKFRDASGMHGVKLRLRGKGSGFKEGPNNTESDDDLHLCVSSKFLEVSNVDFHSIFPMHRESIMIAYETFKFACRSIETLLSKIYDDYQKFMKEKHNQNISIIIKKYENNPAILFSQMDIYPPFNA